MLEFVLGVMYRWSGKAKVGSTRVLGGEVYSGDRGEGVIRTSHCALRKLLGCSHGGTSRQGRVWTQIYIKLQICVQRTDMPKDLFGRLDWIQCCLAGGSIVFSLSCLPMSRAPGSRSAFR